MVTMTGALPSPPKGWRKVPAIWRELVRPNETPPNLRETTRLYRKVTVGLYLFVMLCMIGIGIVVLYQAVARQLQRGQPLSLRVSTTLGGLILAVIIFELLETVFKQLVEGERLSVTLVNNFLIIGAVSAVRHILVLGASLSDQGNVVGAEHVNDIHELYANVVLIAVLLSGIRLIRGMVKEERAQVRPNDEIAAAPLLPRRVG